jgi:hypothetical protein
MNVAAKHDHELVTLERHDHSEDPYFPDPWDKHRRPAEAIL